jgi:ferredoxin-type protein NapH
MDCFAICPEKHVITPALKDRDEGTQIILSPDCTNCGRCIDICALDVFQFTHRFNDRTIAVGGRTTIDTKPSRAGYVA